MINITIRLVMTNSDDTLYRNRRSETSRVDIYNDAFDLLHPVITDATRRGTKVLMSTGRNAEQVSYITNRIGMTGLSICEMGQTILVPSANGNDFRRGRAYFGELRQYDLPDGARLYVRATTPTTQHSSGFSFPTVHAFWPQLSGTLEEVWRMMEGINVDDIREQFGDSTLICLYERKNILTFELIQRTGEELKQFMLFNRHSPLTPKARELIADNKMVLIASRGALDIQPPITKETTARDVMNVYGISPEEALYIGDSDHSDGPVISIMKHGGAVANANPPLKERVRSKGEYGYTSEYTYTQGTRDVLNHFEPLLPDHT